LGAEKIPRAGELETVKVLYEFHDEEYNFIISLAARRFHQFLAWLWLTSTNWIPIMDDEGVADMAFSQIT
jgi:hypothetical protein